MITIQHLRKEYPNVTPLQDVNAEIRDGDVISIIGPSGTGKSTLLRCLNRLETPTSGEVWVDGVNVLDPKADIYEARKKMGMVFQSFNLFSHLTVMENITLGPTRLLRTPPAEAEKEGARLLHMVGLAEKADSFPDELSGGQKQRVAIARTLAMHPSIVLFDEPTSALDPTMAGEVLAVIRNLRKEGLTMMIVTHEMKFARDVSTRVFYMDEGVVYEEGAPEQIFDHPQRDKTRAFVQRLKTLERVITSPAYDFIQVEEALRAFGEKHVMAERRVTAMQRCFEEMAAQTVIPRLGPSFRLTVSVEYAEEADTVAMRLRYGGEALNPMDDQDSLSAMLVRHSIKDSAYEYADGENRLTLLL